MNESDYAIHDVNIREVPYFPLAGAATTITRITIYVGAHGPFSADFGPGQKYPLTTEAINNWKRSQVAFVMSAAQS